MDTLRKQVARARRRLTLARFVAALAWCLLAALGLAIVGVAVIKIWPLPVDGAVWTAAWIGGSLAVGLIAAIIWAWLKREDDVRAAIEIDGRFGLKERVSSALAMRPEDLDTAAGQALLSDAVRRVERVDIGSQFKLPLRREALLPLAPEAILAVLAFVADKPPATPVKASTELALAQRAPQTVEVLRKKFEERKKEASEKGLKDAGDLFKKIEEGLKDITAKSGADQKQALVKLNDLAKQLDERRKELGADEKLKQQLNQMKDLKEGPADKLTEALKKGNFDKALKELDKLQKELESDKLDAGKQQQMAQQLDALRENLEKLAAKQEAMKKQLEQQIKQLADAAKDAAKSDSGKPDSAKSAEAQKAKQQMEKLQDQLSKLQQQAPQMDQLKKLAEQCKQCSQGMKSGNSGAAQQSLQQLAQQLSDLKKQSDETQMLDAAMDQIAEAKESMAGEKSSQDMSQLDDQLSMQQQGGGGDKQDGPPGSGLGQGKGVGPRPESKTATKFYDSNVKQKLGEGAAVASGPSDGPNIKGQVQAQIKAEIDSATHDASDPLTGQRLPRSQREHAKEYFDALREGN